MEYIIVAFRSRAHTVKFHEFLRRNGIFSEVINTPKEAGVGCGLSVKVSKERFSIVKNLAYSANLGSLAGFFIYKTVGGKRTVRSI
ncbi:MAG: DUF3343 domain-containing protein [Clostridia bacterium]|nr:DUF3343 domain-containing protein [Clostridia bacterium]